MTAIIRISIVCALVLSAAGCATTENIGTIDPAIATYVEPKDIKWVPNAAGTAELAVMYGDPSKPGLYITRNKWKAGNMSRPHFHPNDRLIVVLSGTWWVGTGDVFDPNTTVPMRPGTYVTHFAKKIHYDGAKDEDTIIEIHGMGPATSTPAERKP
ncbi:MAG: cupin domain-containing protein [Betaproteobacteria bacterium]|nr:cupin domain-containing protein [Betaproteobacteria bacterium]